jgi:hypothetical protein
VIIGIQKDAELWEMIAAVQVCQSQGVREIAGGLTLAQPLGWLLGVAGLRSLAILNGEGVSYLDFDKAYRAMASAKETYPAVLARVSGLPVAPIRSPQFPGLTVTPSTDGGIIVCPHAAVEAFELPWQVWRSIVRHLRSYGVPVRFMGRSGERMDYANFTEAQNLSDLPLTEQMRAMASAKLILGVPNEWTWSATAWQKKIVVLHPDNLPHERWFGFDVSPRTLGRLLYTSSQLQIPVILAGLRKLIDVM